MSSEPRSSRYVADGQPARRATCQLGLSTPPQHWRLHVILDGLARSNRCPHYLVTVGPATSQPRPVRQLPKPIYSVMT